VSKTSDFETLVLAHLDAAYNLARWLVRDDTTAEDLVQDAALRAFRYFGSLRGDQARPWLLGIVRNACFTWLEEQRQQPGRVEWDEEVVQAAGVAAAEDAPETGPEAALDGKRTRARVDAAIRSLSPPFREVVVLRELEGLSYGEIAQIAGIPIGTVMSRLARARDVLRTALADAKRED